MVLLKKVIQPILKQISLIAAQDQVSLERYLSLVADQNKCQLAGNIKYELNLEPELLNKIAELRQTWQLTRPVWIAASTHQGEDEILLNAHRLLLEKYPNLLLILVPRHPERFSAVEKLIQQQNFSYIKRSQNMAPTQQQLLLVDSMGELMLFYGLADIAFIGGSLIKRGGHNPLEAMAFKLPIISGKHSFNFPEIYQKLRDANAVIEVENDELAVRLDELLSSQSLRENYGQAGYNLLQQNRGALQRLMDLIKPYLEA